ncbi:unnamed protein product [Arctogadus glacialis]
MCSHSVCPGKAGESGRMGTQAIRLPLLIASTSVPVDLETLPQRYLLHGPAPRSSQINTSGEAARWVASDSDSTASV